MNNAQRKADPLINTSPNLPLPTKIAPVRRPLPENENSYSSRQEIISSVELLSILRTMCAQRALITCFINQGKDHFLTTIMGVSLDGKRLFIDYGNNEKTNRKALQARRINCQSRQEHVLINFTLYGLKSVQYEGRDAFAGDAPDVLIRLQRRSSYRLQTLKANPPTADIPLKQADGTSLPLKVVVDDISEGGVGLFLMPGQPRLAKDEQLVGVTIELDEIGRVVADMSVSNTLEESLPNGKLRQRAVCQFINLTKPMMNLIRRYSLKIQRERIRRAKGVSLRA